jgi:lambda family phage portal protein
VMLCAPGIAAQRAEHHMRRMAAEGAARVLGGGDMQAAIDPRNSGGLPSSSGGIRRMWGSVGRDAVSDTLQNLKYDRANSRDLARSSPIAAGAINTNIDRVVGTGLALSATPNATVLGWTAAQVAEWKAKTQIEFSLWADSTDCDLTGQHTFYQLQGLVLRAVLESGDAFTNMPDAKPADMVPTQPYRLRLQVIEADRVGNEANGMDTAEVSGGIKIDPATGRPKAAFIYDQHPGANAATAAAGLFKGAWFDMVGSTGRRRLLHHFRKLRPGQPRGLPYLAPIIDCIKQISRYTEAEIMAAVVTSYFTVFVQSDAQGSTPPVYTGPDAPTADVEVALGQGAVVPLAPGETVNFANPLRPNPNFEPFINAVITQMGMALGLPYELLVKKFNASFSASKGALLDAWVYLRSVRTWLSLSFCQPAYETWLAESVAIGRISAPGFFADPLMRWAYTRAMWPGDSMGSLSPKDEVAAYVAAVDARLMTRERAEWELFGTDFNDTFDQKVDEHKSLESAGILPTPKAGAPAPPKPGAPGDDPADDESADDATPPANQGPKK